MPDRRSAIGRWRMRASGRKLSDHAHGLPDTWFMPQRPLEPRAAHRLFIVILWATPILVTLAGSAILAWGGNRQWVAYVAFGLAAISALAAVRAQRKAQARLESTPND